MSTVARNREDRIRSLLKTLTELDIVEHALHAGQWV